MLFCKLFSFKQHSALWVRTLLVLFAPVGSLPLPIGSPWVEVFSWLLSVWLVHLPHNESLSQMDSLNMLIKAHWHLCVCMCVHSCTHTQPIDRFMSRFTGQRPALFFTDFRGDKLPLSLRCLSLSPTNTHVGAHSVLRPCAHIHVQTYKPAMTSYFKYTTAGTCIQLCTINFAVSIPEARVQTTWALLSDNVLKTAFLTFRFNFNHAPNVTSELDIWQSRRCVSLIVVWHFRNQANWDERIDPALCLCLCNLV